ncbi:MAG: hypothetical protein DRI26_01050 [Chloroflexi bacterium]|nr:MAG: hypothetical protein DRI26_01050 [Chloroflexota bacterium]
MVTVWYVYPQWRKVSFSIIAEHHIAELQKYMRIYTVDELALPNIYPFSDPLIILHPLFYPMVKYARHIERIYNRIHGIIGVDVADSDRITNLAVSITNYCEAIIVPSKWSRDAYVNSGVTTPVYVIPHGLEKTYFEKPKEIKAFQDLLKLKQERKLTYLLFFCWHSEYRKGLDLVLKVYDRIRQERKDIVLITKFMTKEGKPHRIIRRLGGIIIAGWLTEEQKLELYDLCDIYLGFSRGGGFELNFLEALARGEIVVAADRGAWTDYLPDFCLVKSHPCPYVLKDNPIHCGRGAEIDVEKAVDKVLEVTDNLEDYKARVREYVDKVIKKNYTWENIGQMLYNVIKKYI